MDTWAFVIIIGSGILYFVSKKKPVFILTLGVGLGLLWGAIWASVIVSSAFGGL